MFLLKSSQKSYSLPSLTDIIGTHPLISPYITFNGPLEKSLHKDKEITLKYINEKSHENQYDRIKYKSAQSANSTRILWNILSIFLNHEKQYQVNNMIIKQQSANDDKQLTIKKDLQQMLMMNTNKNEKIILATPYKSSKVIDQQQHEVVPKKKPNKNEIYHQIQNYIMIGKRLDAIHLCMANELWTDALLLASYDIELYSQIINLYTKSILSLVIHYIHIIL